MSSIYMGSNSNEKANKTTHGKHAKAPTTTRSVEKHSSNRL